MSTVSPEDRAAMADILERLIGTETAPTGDIGIEVGGERYVIKSQEGGAYSAASVER